MKFPNLTPQLMTTATVFVQNRDRNLVKCRALLDTCATANFISEKLAKSLNLPITPCTLPVGAINSIGTMSKGIVSIVIRSLYNQYRKNLLCLSIPTIANLVPAETFPRHLVKIPPNIKLADPEFHLPQTVDLLIGSGTTVSLFSIGQIDLSQENRELYLQKTRLGWIIAGGTTSRNRPTNATCQLTDFEQLITKFWTIEDLPFDSSKSVEDLECEKHFLENATREKDGRYKVRLPFRESAQRLGESRISALKRLNHLERKLNLDPTLKHTYSQVIQEYLDLKQMSLVEDPIDDGFYLPHHAVIKDTSATTKIRVVFDASAKSSTGTSLNDILMIGPTIQNTLFTHLIRFRTYVITADIEKMYRQIWLHENDRIYQRLLWRHDNRLRTLQLNTLTFGVSSSPYLAIRTIHKLADDESREFPTAARILKEHLYVDDLLTGANTIIEARAIRDDITTLLARGGFHIRQWASNNICIINDLKSDAINSNLILDKDNYLKTLGLSWHTHNDVLRYSTHSINHARRITKRVIFSEIAKIYDPLGILGPIILYAKRLMQNLWRNKLDWDESIPSDIHTTWVNFATQLELINDLSIDRLILTPDYANIQIHGFCDASQEGYGACIYIRSENQNGDIQCRLLCAKSRVAPLKSTTIPRLELCGALLLAKLYDEIQRTLEIVSHKIVLWCDSTITLHWIKTPPYRLKTFVSHRVAQIQNLTDSQFWRHVKSEDNPADALSRGQLPNAFIKNQLWFSGPSWLSEIEDKWYNENTRLEEIPELRKNICLATVSYDLEILKKYSSYARLLRVIAWCLRFRHNNTYRGLLHAREIDETEVKIMKIIQAVYFARELHELKNKRSTHKGNIAALNPFIDENGLIRVGGRLKMSELAFPQKHPILLPSRHFLTDLIIKETHERHYHTGVQTTLYIIRRKFWIPDGRNQVRRVVRTCVRCFRFNAETVQYKMSNLPKMRVCNTTPFYHTGIDFCGPFHVKEKKHRNRNKIKTYVCVFVCMAVKAVHLEVVSDLTTDGFLAALRRFAARRGIPAHIYSDNGTNFRGASNQLRELYVLFNSDEHRFQVNRFSVEKHITWHFIPPIAPHFGGLWETTVKLFKHHFKRVVGDLLFIFEELNTFTIEIEGILNSRPLTPLSTDPNDILVLTPAHCLIGKPLTTLPEIDFTSVPANRLSTWQHIVKVRQDFWNRWNLEYLNELQIRHKWTKDGENINIGTVVLLKEKNLPCNQWALGKIIEVHPGEDGVTRAVTVKTATGEIKRAVKCICPLPIEQCINDSTKSIKLNTPATNCNEPQYACNEL